MVERSKSFATALAYVALTCGVGAAFFVERLQAQPPIGDDIGICGAGSCITVSYCSGETSCPNLGEGKRCTSYWEKGTGAYTCSPHSYYSCYKLWPDEICSTKHLCICGYVGLNLVCMNDTVGDGNPPYKVDACLIK